MLPKGESNPNENKPTPNETVATAPVTPVETATTPSPEVTNNSEKPLTVEDLEIEAGESDLQLATDIVSRINQWQMAGATPETYNTQDLSIDTAEYAEKVASKIAPTFAEALYGKDYTSNPSIKTALGNTTRNNKVNIELYLRTFDSSLNPNNLEPYKIDTTLQELISGKVNPDGSRELVFKTIHKNNTEKNIVEDEPTGYGIWTVNLVNDGQKETIVSFSAVEDTSAK